MAELIREALRAYLGGEQRKAPPGAGAFRSGRRDTAERAEAIVARAESLRLPRIATTDRRDFEPLAEALSLELLP